MATGTVTVVSARASTPFEISDTLKTVDQVVKKFLGTTQLKGYTVRLNNATLNVDDLTQPLENEDVIFVSQSNIPNAGFKGAVDVAMTSSVEALAS